MDDTAIPIVNEWYLDSRGDYLMVIAVDEDEDIIEAQYFEGEIEEFDFETWNAMGFESSDAPEDWTGSFDNVDKDDMGDTEHPMHTEDWNGPADEMEKMD